LTKEQLREAKNEIDQLRYYIQKYQSEIGTLKQKNDSLARENSVLTTSFTQEKSKNNQLTDQNVLLSNKVAQAQTLKAFDINGYGVRFKGSGEEIEASRAKNTEKVRLDFKVIDNDVAEKGIKTIYIRILNPTGGQEVITDAMESKFVAEGQEMVFTSKANINFDNTKGKTYTVYWSKNSLYEKGVYKAILYSDQRKIGESNFELK
jgi:predicted nuclease with TOPRIM domain